ncbi:MAG: prolipoprotein diacylglyceryl transferase [Desulfovibrionales bacterium]
MTNAAIVWDISPEIFSYGPVSLRWYGVLFALVFFLGFFIIHHIYKIEEKPSEDLDRLLLVMVAGTLIGARLGHVFFYEPSYFFENPLEILKIWKGGLASHGGVIGIVLAVFLYSRSRPDQPLLWLLDRLCIPAMLGASLIRIGNLFNSEIIGIPTDVPWAVVFARVDPLPRHPVQLYEAGAYLLIFLLLLVMYLPHKSNLPHGRLLGLTLVLGFCARFVLEFFKTRQEEYLLTIPLNAGQLLSLPLILVGMALLWNSYQSAKQGEGTGPGLNPKSRR